MKRLRTYTIGAIEKTTDGGAGWRNDLDAFFEELNVEVFDPVKLEGEKNQGFGLKRLPKTYTDMFGNVHSVKTWHSLKDSSDPKLYAKFKRLMRNIIKVDIQYVRKCDFVVAYWDEAARAGGGSYCEIYDAYMNNIPVYCVMVTECPAWVKACCDEIFLSFDALKEFLKEEYGD